MARKSTLSSYQPLRARPERPDNEFLLRDHLLNVQTKGKVILEKTVANSGFWKTDTYLDYATKALLVRIITGSHDIGKASRFFQDYVNPPRRNTGKRKAHSPLSAVFAIFVAKRLLSNDPRAAVFSALVALCVLAHHGRLESPSKSARNIHSMMDIIGDQINSIKNLYLTEVDEICESLGFPPFSEFETQWKNVFGEFIRLQGATSYDPNDLGLYYTVNDLFSTLIDADRLDAAELKIPDRLFLPFETIQTNINRIQQRGRQNSGRRVIKIREAIFSIVSSKAQNAALDQKLFSLTAPTGSGKTLTAFSFALKLRERSGDRNPRIIYVAPFLSIIDQNLEVFKETLAELGRRSDIILAHHHLCELIYRDESTDYSTDKSILLIEGWNSEIIVTTFIQFLCTILGRGSKELRKLHNISGCIVILDEVQAIPVEYWKLVRQALRYLSTAYNVTFVLMTATQPLIFEKSEIIELVDNYREYFKERNTTLDLSVFEKRSQTQSGPKTILEFAEFVLEYTKGKASNRNLMIVMNTIGCATHLYDRLSESNLRHNVQYLSAEVTPKERSERLDSIKKQTEENRRNPADARPVLLVTTQLVEAGVDIDFDLVMRDIAPVDSIIQCAGRCNRSGTRPREESVVTVVELVDEDGKPFARKVYGNISIQKTIEILSEWDASRSFQELSDAYYNQISAARSERAEEDIFKGIAALDYDKLDDFQLIEERPGGSVFIELDDNAVSLFNNYKEIWSEHRPRGSATKEFLKIRSDFYQYVVNVPEQYVSHLGEPIYGIYYVGRDSLRGMYGETGFIRRPSGVI
jgi:CRISPR-associated endonuclease/helicase Cas3